MQSARKPFEQMAAETEADPRPSFEVQQGADPTTLAGDKPSSISPPGIELPTAVYLSVLACFLLILVASWLSFGTTTEADLNLAVVTLIFLMFLAIPSIIQLVGRARSGKHPPTVNEFMSSSIDTYTGPLPASEVWLQIIIIPLTLALGGILICIVHGFFEPLPVIN